MRNIVLSLVVCFTALLSLGIYMEAMAQNYNQTDPEEMPADYHSPFPDEEFSFSRFETQEEFGDYVRNRFPIGTPRKEVEKILIDIGGAGASKIINLQMKKQKQYHIRYRKYTWRNFLMQLMMSPDGSTFVGVDYDENNRVIKRMGNL